MAKIWVLQHHRNEHLGTIADALEDAALAWQYVRLFDGRPVPADMRGAGGLIVMGGPMGVYEQDRYPFLREEIGLIERALSDGKPVLGVCLGSQLLAAALGARVTPGTHSEIGWRPVRLLAPAGEDRLFAGLPGEFTACHWHNDVFELPHGATALAESDLTSCQAFRYGDNAYGLLFHVELTSEMVAQWAEAFASDLEMAKIEAGQLIDEAKGHEISLRKLSATIFRRWAAPIEGT